MSKMKTKKKAKGRKRNRNISQNTIGIERKKLSTIKQVGGAFFPRRTTLHRNTRTCWIPNTRSYFDRPNMREKMVLNQNQQGRLTSQ